MATATLTTTRTRKVRFTDSLGCKQYGTWVARHTDYAVPLNEIKYGREGYTALLKDDEFAFLPHWEHEREWFSCPGMEVCVGDKLITGEYVARLQPGRCAGGAIFQDAYLDDGGVVTLWNCFLYHIAR